jgi:hypothetical protein
MTSVLSHAARVLGSIVDEAGESRDTTISVVAELLALPLEQARTVAQRVSDAGLIEIADDHIRPTLRGVAMGAALAMARNRVRVRVNRLSGGPFWTYLPQEVSLSG